jgi:hypothetical protein
MHDRIPDKPVKCSFWQTDEGVFCPVKTVSTLRKDTDLIEYFPFWADLLGF